MDAWFYKISWDFPEIFKKCTWTKYNLITRRTLSFTNFGLDPRITSVFPLQSNCRPNHKIGLLSAPSCVPSGG